jgi:pyruvate/2-oxoglutarate dehydrogenase complex dihydrolipoamide acyltransferase (E2) component
MAKRITDRVEAGLVEKDFEQQPFDEAIAAGEHIPLDELDEANADSETFGAPHGSPITFAPSNSPNPYMSEEEQGMDMKPTVVGPPAYGSPDPTTSAGKLLPLEQHPLRADALPEGHPAAIDESYGEGYDGVLHGTDALMTQPRVPGSDLERHLVGDFTKEQLEAKNADVDATKAARDFALEKGVDLNDVDGTGEDGRVTKTDVADYLADNEDDESESDES